MFFILQLASLNKVCSIHLEKAAKFTIRPVKLNRLQVDQRSLIGQRGMSIMSASPSPESNLEIATFVFSFLYKNMEYIH